MEEKEQLEAEKGIIQEESPVDKGPLTEEEKLDEDEDIDLIKASDIVRDFFIKMHQPWIFFFQIHSVEKNCEDHVYIVKCSFFPVQGSYEKNNYTVRVNIRTGKITDIKGYSQHTKTKIKTKLETPDKS